MKMARLQQLFAWILLDVLVVWLAYSMAWSARALTARLVFRDALLPVLVAMIVTIACLWYMGVYRRLWRHASGHGIVSIFYGSALSGFILLVLNLGIGAATSSPRPMPLSILLVGHILAFGGFVIMRYRSRLLKAMRWRYRAVFQRRFPGTGERVLIVGAGESGQITAWRFQHKMGDDNDHYQVVGFVDDDERKQGLIVEGRPVLGTTDEIPRLSQEHNIDLIVLSIHKIDGPAFREILTQCEKTNARIKVVPNMIAQMQTKQGSDFLRNVQPEDLIGRSLVTRHDAVDLSPAMGRVVLVTGAAGSIGSELSRQMMDYNPTKLIIVDNNESGLHDLHVELRAKQASFDIVPALVDVTRKDDVQKLFDKYNPQIVYHAAAYKHVPMMEMYPNEAVRVNVGGTLNVALAALDARVERFVLISTDKAVNPSSVMGASKRLCEKVVQSLGAKQQDTLFTAVRFGNVLGSRGSIVPTFTRQIEKGGPVTVTHRDMRRYFMSIPEAVNLVIHAGALTNGGDVFLLRMGEEVRILDIAERMIRLRGLRPYLDIPIEFIGMRPGEKLREELFDPREAPSDTIHPHIVQLNGAPIVEPDTLLTEAAEFVTIGIVDDDIALKSICDLCDSTELTAQV